MTKSAKFKNSQRFLSKVRPCSNHSSFSPPQTGATISLILFGYDIMAYPLIPIVPAPPPLHISPQFSGPAKRALEDVFSCREITLKLFAGVSPAEA
jgi:hypothetical protein